MPVNLHDYAKRMADDLERERVHGISVLYDDDTDNVVVHDGTKGFCVTRLAYQTLVYPKVLMDVLEALDAMRLGRAASQTGVKFSPVGELLQKVNA